MKEERIIKLIRSDVGMLVTIVSVTLAILGPWYQVREQIALMNQKIDYFKLTLDDVIFKNNEQDSKIGQTATDVARIDGRLNHGQ